MLEEELEWRDSTGDYPAYQRRKSDNLDRVTGFPYSNKIPRGYWDEED